MKSETPQIRKDREVKEIAQIREVKRRAQYAKLYEFVESTEDDDVLAQWEDLQNYVKETQRINLAEKQAAMVSGILMFLKGEV